METKIYKQFGTASVIILLPLMLFFCGLLIKTGFSTDPATIILLLVIVTLLICLLVFYQLTIMISSNSISFSLGIGLAGRTYRFSDIKSCKAVTNSALNGIGIRMLSNGWLYNVTGLKAIELQFKNRKSVVRIGTDKPEEIANLINSRIAQGNAVADDYGLKKKMFNPMWIIMVILVLLPVALLVSSKQDTNIYSTQNSLIIEGSYGLTIPYYDIIQVDTISSLPQISIRTNGYALGNTKIGNFRLADGKDAKLYVKSEFPPYILIQSKENGLIYINFEEANKTIDLYDKLKKNK
ncbi:hypothetical protein [uncultured Acetobacteroides sp.]|uniref:hypothetical protein n=1 Tax=uncultured Acetobacteroides sp. TaxID=1760811 RepID=UPI0029F48558|nr:hypothetical protein [uncultured Acetobacteroides sp.]